VDNRDFPRFVQLGIARKMERDVLVDQSRAHVEGEDEESRFQSFVVEAKELVRLVLDLVANGPQEDTKAAVARVKEIVRHNMSFLITKSTKSTLISRSNQQLEKYQEQPSLLDPHMEGLVVPLMRRVRAHRDRSVAGSSEPEEDAFVLAIFRLLYTLCKVRGYKTVGMSLHCAAMPHIFSDHIVHP